jgi:hypothetical protein
MNFLKLFLFLTSFLLASIPASAEAKNINFTSSETKPYTNAIWGFVGIVVFVFLSCFAVR